MNSNTARRRAFTLIELLVVIAIIAILAAILFPVFAQAKLAAKKTQDLSNIKQVILAVTMYATDNDGMYHRLQTGGLQTAPNFLIGPEEALANYVKSQEIWKSPNDALARQTCGRGANPPGFKISYSFTFKGADTTDADGFNSTNMYYGAHGTTNNTNVSLGDSLTESAIGATASTINIYPLWMSSSTSNLRSWWRFYNSDLRSLPVFPQALGYDCITTGDGRLSIGAYNGKSNWGFIDGHVSSMAQAQVADSRWGVSTAASVNQAIAAKAKNLFHFSEEYK